MKRTFRNISFFGIAATIIAVAACEPEIQGIEPTAGQANFSKYIAVGNSLTAGFADGGLYLEGQKVAFPNLMAEQMKAVGGGAFHTPFFSEAQRNGSGYVRLKALVNGQPVTENVTSELAVRGLNASGGRLYTRYTNTDEISNYGVPGMRLDMAFAPGIGTVMGNPFFERILPEDEPQTTTYFSHVTKQDYTFFSFWLGNNDALGYATNGAVHEGPTTKLTDEATFKALYNQFLTELTKNGRKGVVATIPDVTAVPYFNTVTTALLEAGVSAATNGAFKKIYISTANGAREATSEDLFMLTFPRDTLGTTVNTIPAYGFVQQNPLHSKFVLDKDEVAEVSARVNAFNAIIKAAAEEKGLALADAHAYLNRVKNPGIRHNGINITASFVTGNAFSMDGIHLTPMGNALIANLFIDAINAKYGSSITKVDVAQYRGVAFP